MYLDIKINKRFQFTYQKKHWKSRGVIVDREWRCFSLCFTYWYIDILRNYREVCLEISGKQVTKMHKKALKHSLLIMTDSCAFPLYYM